MEQTDNRDQLAHTRTLLAAERTFSAWIRTGLAGIGGGLAVVKLVPFRNIGNQSIARLTGQVLVLWGAAIFIFALLDYLRSRRVLGHDDMARSSPWVMALITATLLIVAGLVFWLTIQATVS